MTGLAPAPSIAARPSDGRRHARQAQDRAAHRAGRRPADRRARHRRTGRSPSARRRGSSCCRRQLATRPTTRSKPRWSAITRCSAATRTSRSLRNAARGDAPGCATLAGVNRCWSAASPRAGRPRTAMSGSSSLPTIRRPSRCAGGHGRCLRRRAARAKMRTERAARRHSYAITPARHCGLSILTPQQRRNRPRRDDEPRLSIADVAGAARRGLVPDT